MTADKAVEIVGSLQTDHFTCETCYFVVNPLHRNSLDITNDDVRCTAAFKRLLERSDLSDCVITRNDTFLYFDVCFLFLEVSVSAFPWHLTVVLLARCIM